MKFINLQQGSPEWLEYRKDKFNASEAGDVMGCGFNKPYKLAEIKYGGKEIFQSEAMRLGKEYEPKIREYINKLLNADFQPVVGLSDDDPRFSASFDGLDIIGGEILEIKFSANEYEVLERTGKPSEKYFWQIQHQLFVCDLSKCIFAVGKIDDDFDLQIRHIVVERDEKAIKKLIKAWNEFEATYAGAAPDEEWLSLSDEISTLSAQKKELDDRLDELKKRAIKKAGGVEIKAYGLTVCKSEIKPSYDYKAYCEQSGAVIPDEFLKAGCERWSVRVAN